MGIHKFVMKHGKIFCDGPFIVKQSDSHFFISNAILGYHRYTYSPNFNMKEVAMNSVKKNLISSNKDGNYVYEYKIPNDISVSEIITRTDLSLDIEDCDFDENMKFITDDHSKVNFKVTNCNQLNLNLFTGGNSNLKINAPISLIKAEINDNSSVNVSSQNKVEYCDITVLSHNKIGSTLCANFIANHVNARAIGNSKILRLNIEGVGDLYSTDDGKITGIKLPTTKINNRSEKQIKLVTERWF